jgi:signal transduction histidine kinase/CheY-like chemotaxis protein
MADNGSSRQGMFLRSPLARRILLLFIACAVVPLIAFGVYSLQQVLRTLDEQARDRLQQETKTVGQGILARLELMDSELQLAEVAIQTGGWSSSSEAARSLLGDHFSAVVLEPGARPGPARLLLGEGVETVELTSEELAHVAAGDTLVLTVDGDDPLRARVFMIRTVAPPGTGVSVMWAEIDSDYLWNIGRHTTLPPGTDLCVLQGSEQLPLGRARTIVRSAVIPTGFGTIVDRQLGSKRNSTFEWREESTSYLAGAYTMSVKSRYHADLWTVVLSRDRRAVLEPVARVRRTLSLLVLATMWVVLLASVSQIRRSLGPLQELREGTRRIARRDFSNPVVVNSHDEFEELAAAFNAMSDRLARQFDALSTMETVARRALESVNEAVVLREILPSVRRLIGCRRVRVLTPSDDPREMRTFSIGESDTTPGAVRESSVSVDELPEIADLRRGRSVVEAAGTEIGGQARILQPLMAGDELIGILELIDVGPSPEPPAPGLAGEIAEQLAIALHQARLRRTLDAERLRLQRMMEYLPSGVVLLDADDRIVLANRIARDCLTALTEVGPGDRLERLGERALTSIIEAAGGRFQEIRVESPTVVRTFEVAAGRLEGSGMGRYTTIVLREVTREREIEAQMQRQERLAAVGRLTAGITHDFNNILQGITMAGDLLRLTDGVPGELKSMAEDVSREASRGARMIRQILDFSRRSPSAHQPVDIGELIGDTIRLLRRTLPENIVLQLDLGVDEAMAMAEPTQLQQVLMNLAVNSRDAMPEGGTLQIRVDALEIPVTGTRPVARMEAGEWLVLTFSDSGTGIPQEIQSRVFEPFFTTKAEGEGTGLGLAQVFGIVRQHGGYVDLSSRAGEGTTVRVFLPRLRQHQAAAPTVSPETLPRGGGERVLVVENKPLLLRQTVATLTRLGYRAVGAASVDEALVALHESLPDLILSDVVMPGRGGLDLLDLVRRNWPDLPTILMSGNVTDELIGRWCDRGATHVLEKPFDASKLASTFHVVLGSTVGATPSTTLDQPSNL